MGISVPDSRWHLFLGGTFDPVHFGHLRSALEVGERFFVEEVYLMPCHDPVHGKIPGATALQRVEMLERAVCTQAGERRMARPLIRIDRREVQREGESYMVDTLIELRKEKGASCALGLLMGEDSLISFRTWRRWKEILSLSNLIVFHRPGWSREEAFDVLNAFSALGVGTVSVPASAMEPIPHHPCGHLYITETSQVSVSSSQIRRLLGNQRSARYLLPDSVLEYIRSHELYGVKD